MVILVTAASGQLGRLTLDALLARDVDPTQIRAGARRPEVLSTYADRGVEVVHLDYDDDTSVRAAVDGADRVLLISGVEGSDRAAQHRGVVEAAAAAGVGLLAYTSAPRADRTTLVVAPDHAATEQAVRDSGIPFTFLRNNWYHENYGRNVPAVRATGVLVTSTGAGRVASAARADYAEAAAVVLTGAGHEGRTYELGGDEVWDYDALVTVLAEVLRRDVARREVSTEEHVAILEQAGLPPAVAAFAVAIDTGIRAGELDPEPDTMGTLSGLIGRPTTPLLDGLRAVAG